MCYCIVIAGKYQCRLYGGGVKRGIFAITGCSELAQEVYRWVLQLAWSSDDPTGRLDGVAHSAASNQTADIHVCATRRHSAISITVRLIALHLRISKIFKHCWCNVVIFYVTEIHVIRYIKSVYARVLLARLHRPEDEYADTTHH